MPDFSFNAGDSVCAWKRQYVFFPPLGFLFASDTRLGETPVALDVDIDFFENGGYDISAPNDRPNVEVPASGTQVSGNRPEAPGSPTFAPSTLAANRNPSISINATTVNIFNSDDKSMS